MVTLMLCFGIYNLSSINFLCQILIQYCARYIDYKKREENKRRKKELHEICAQDIQKIPFFAKFLPNYIFFAQIMEQKIFLHTKRWRRFWLKNNFLTIEQRMIIFDLFTHSKLKVSKRKNQSLIFRDEN